MGGRARWLIGAVGALSACGGETAPERVEPGAPNPFFSVDEVTANACIPRALAVSPEGSIGCTVVDVRVVDAGGRCSRCESGTVRSPVSDHLARAVQSRLEAMAYCGSDTGRNCSAPSTTAAGHCQCELRQLSGEDGAACRSDPAPRVSGWCYVDPEQGFGDPALVAGCSGSSPQMLRFVGSAAPTSDAKIFIACPGQYAR